MVTQLVAINECHDRKIALIDSRHDGCARCWLGGRTAGLLLSSSCLESGTSRMLA